MPGNERRILLLFAVVRATIYYGENITIVMGTQAKNANYFGSNLLLLMKGCGVTQEGLADDLGFSQSAISNYLNGRIPKTAILFALSNHFRVSATDLVHKNLSAEPGFDELWKVPTSVVRRRRTSYDRLLARFEGLSEEESERWSKAFLKMLDEVTGTQAAAAKRPHQPTSKAYQPTIAELERLAKTHPVAKTLLAVLSSTQAATRRPPCKLAKK